MDKDFDFVTIDYHISYSKQYINKRKRRECRNDQYINKRKPRECRNDLSPKIRDASPSRANEDRKIRDPWSQSGLSCPLCRGLMKDAVLAKCCFKSFCDKCITDRINSNSLCFCGATNVVADDFLPNRTLRDLIAWYLKSNNCSGANSSRTFQPQGTQSAQ